MTIKNQNMALVVLLGDAYHKTKKLLVDGNYMMKCLDTFRVYYLRLCDIILDICYNHTSSRHFGAQCKLRRLLRISNTDKHVSLVNHKLTSVVSIFSNLSSAFPRMSKILTSPCSTIITQLVPAYPTTS
jgi:hypothetical protein